MQLAELLTGLDKLIPFRYAEDWDKVGLHIGNPASVINRVQVALDLTAESITAAVHFQADLLLVHHPPIFSPLNGLRSDQPVERPVLAAVQAGLSVVALHTNLDAVPGGVPDQFAELIGLNDVITLAPLSETIVNDDTDRYVATGSESGGFASAFTRKTGFRVFDAGSRQQ